MRLHLYFADATPTQLHTLHVSAAGYLDVNVLRIMMKSDGQRKRGLGCLCEHMSVIALLFCKRIKKSGL